MTFSYTGAAQTWTVPTGVTSVQVIADGAQGDGAFGGLGAQVQATLAVTPGQVLNVYVGGAGAGRTGGFNGGGSLDPNAPGTVGGGGGASDVRVGGSALSNRVLVAGGGGGAGTSADAVYGTGGSGGGLVGETGGDGDGQYNGGGGGTQTAGGAAGNTLALPGSLGQGGSSQYQGGCGGGGYYGGGAGASSSSGGSAGGGGGGSSYADPGATNVAYLAGTQTGNGQVTITYPPPSGGGTAAPGSATFDYTGGPQTWSVPAGVTSVSVQASGAQGAGTYGGFGAMTNATVPVTAGETLVVMVGGQGSGTSGGFNGGGNSSSGGGNTGSGGGGASDVRIGGLGIGDRVVVAGGGGGAVGGPVVGMGGSSGQNGGAGEGGDGSFQGGGGGSQSAGGASGGDLGGAGRSGHGGNSLYSGGAGGGGYYGGGAGGSNSSGGSPGGGGAGSSFAEQSATNVSFVTGARQNNGLVIISWGQASPLPPTGSGGTVEYSYSGGPRFWTVPAGITQIRVSLTGAAGDAGTSVAGKGGFEQGLVPVTPGQVVAVVVGGRGVGKSGGFNGGGGGNVLGSGGAGGGASDLRVGGVTLADRVLVAAGGGGGASNGSAHGGDGGGAAGAAGQNGSGSGVGGGGGTQTAGGTGSGFSGGGTNGRLGQGGSVDQYGGDGGGGYYGGGTGSSGGVFDTAGGGGGGSSFAAQSVQDAATQSGVQAGDGSAVIDTGMPLLSQSTGVLTDRGTHAISGSRALADPVNTLTGAFINTATDLTLAAQGVSFAYTRTYTSSDATVGRLGPGWTDNYAVSLAVQSNGDVILHGDEGQLVTFIKQADGSFAGAAGTLSTLTTIAGGYKLVRHDQVTYTFNTGGVLQSEVDRNGQGLAFNYDGSGRLATVSDAAGHTITFGYNGTSTLVSSITTPDNRIVSYGYTGGSLSSVALPDPDGNGPLAAPVWSYGYDAAGRLWQVVDPNNKTQSTTLYDPTSGRVTQITDANSKVTHFDWDATTQTATVTDADNHIWKDVYQNNVLLKQIDPAGDATQYRHDFAIDTSAVTAPNGTDTTSMTYQNGNLTSATAPASLGANVQKLFTYTAQNDPQDITDARQKVTHYGYDAAGNNNAISLDGQPVFGATYNAQGQMLTSTDGNGQQTTYTYDGSGNVASVTTPDPDGAGGPLEASTTTYTYDAMGNVLTMVDPRGNCTGCTASNHTTTYTYDRDGHLLTETDPLGNCAGCNAAAHTTTYTYDATSNLKTVKDANGHTTNYDYDNANHLTTITGEDPDGAGPLEAPITTFTYDDAGNRLTMVDPRGNCPGCNAAQHTTTYTYNQNNQLASVTTPRGEKTTYFYDGNGNLASVVDPRGNATGANPDDYRTSYTYDAAGRLLTTTTPDPDGAGPLTASVTTSHYDNVGNVDWTKDANQHQTNYTYDAAGRILTVQAPDGGLTTYTYYGDGSLHTRKDDNNHITTYAYDNAERLTSITGPGASPPLTTYTYDPAGNLASVTDPNGNATQTAGDGTTSYTYDAANRLTDISYSDNPGTPNVHFVLDGVGNRTSMTDGSGTVSYAYDNLNRLLSATRGSDAFSYGYDVAGNITSRTYPGNNQTTYAYDEDNRLQTVTNGGASTSYDYTLNGELFHTTLPSGNGYVETRTYDNAGRLIDLKNAKAGTTLSEFASTLDPVGNPTQIVQTGASPGTQTYTYDANDRLLSVCFEAGTCPNAGDPFIRWTYDKVGNRLTETRPTAATAYSYNAVDELTQTSTSPYAGQAKTDGAQPYWRFGEAANSTGFASTIGSYPGTWSGTTMPTQGVSGALAGDQNTAVTLDGTSQYGSVANASGLNKTNNFSLELWLKRSKNAQVQAVAGKPLTTTTKSENYAIWIDASNNARFEAGSGTKSATVTCTAHPLDTGWHHIVGTFASGALKIYYDGSLCNSATASFTTAGTNTSTFDIGRAGTANYYGGSLDELALYSTALTATQITDHYTKGHSTPTPFAYGYDNNGNETSAGSASLTYDLGNRLKTFASGGTTTTYSYDGDGNRLQASTGSLASQKTNYLWDTSFDLPQLALERDGNNTLLRRYVHGIRRISMTSGGNAYYYQYDPLGSVANVTSTTGATEWTYSYEPFGNLNGNPVQNDPNAPANFFKFAGEYADSTGLIHLSAREANATDGRMLTLDPARPSAGTAYTSLYVYANDQPTVMVDPSGRTFIPSARSTQLTLFAATTTPGAVSPCQVLLVIHACMTHSDPGGDEGVEGGGTSVGVVLATGAIAAIAAAVLSNCIAHYDEVKCISFNWTDVHHIVARTAIRAAEARDIITLPMPDGVDLPMGVDNPHNLVKLPRYAHWFLHNRAYYEEVNRLVAVAFRKGSGGLIAAQPRVAAMLDAIGRTLRLVLGGGIPA